MKRWWIPTVAILGFFILISALFKTLGPADSMKPINSSKIESAINTMSGDTDETQIKFQNKMATSGEKVPSWGALAKSVMPKSESLSFKGPAGKAPSTLAAKATKKDKKKKKKVAEKKKKNKFVVTKLKSNPTQPGQDSISDAGGYATGGMSVPQKQEKDKNAIPETFEEWEEFVLNPPSIDNLMVLIKYHQARLVTDEIFFKLSEKMIRSRNEDIRKFGIIALGSAPGIDSFVLLSYATTEERIAALQTMISSNYQTYASLQYLPVLGSALQSSNAGVRYQAAISLGQSATFNIKKATNPTSNRGRPAGSTAQHYQSFIATLRFMSNSDPSAAVQDAARRTLTVINSLTTGTNVVASN